MPTNTYNKNTIKIIKINLPECVKLGHANHEVVCIFLYYHR